MHRDNRINNKKEGFKINNILLIIILLSTLFLVKITVNKIKDIQEQYEIDHPCIEYETTCTLKEEDGTRMIMVGKVWMNQQQYKYTKVNCNETHTSKSTKCIKRK